jgi:acetoin utilization deacetylase AcuC-like enzyme
VALHGWSSARYVIPLPSGHRFPIEKYERLRQRVVADGLIAAEHLHEPGRVSRDALLLVHTPRYVDSIDRGTLTPDEQRRIGFPWSPALVERSYRSAGGTCEAAGAALRRGVAVNLAGGTHHAFADHGEGFCVFNDVAIAIRMLQRDGRIARAAVIDLDVHQGNGTHAIFAGDESVFTFSMHGGRNYPFRTPPTAADAAAPVADPAPAVASPAFGLRVAGDLDIDLPDGTGDAEYLGLLADALPRVLSASAPDLVIYIAGADPHEGDRLGRMRLTFAGLERRDAMVIESCREIGVPVAVVIGGGYGRDIGDTVSVHRNTVGVAASFG